MIHDIIAACVSGYDLLLIFLAMQGYSLQEIAGMTNESKTTIYRRLRAIRERTVSK